MEFNDWLDEREWGDPRIVEGMVALHLHMKKYWEAGGPPITLPRGEMDFPLHFPGRHLDKVLAPATDGPRIIRGPDQNFLVPLDSLEMIAANGGQMPKGMSHFVRDQPYIGAFAQHSAENMAAAFVFVLLTIRADFMQVMHSFPVIMTLLMTRFASGRVTADQLREGLGDLEGQLASVSKPSTRTANDETGRSFRTGYGNGGQLFGFKYESVAHVWNSRQSLYGTMMELVQQKDTVKLFGFVLRNVHGLAQAKAGFCVQLIFGELGCIDMHNVNLYSQFYLDRGQARSSSQTVSPITMGGGEMRAPVGGRDMRAYNQLNPAVFGPKNKRSAGAVKAYIDTIKMLEKDGFTTIKLWDLWVAYVSRTYVKSKGGSRYARDGMLAGNPMDPENDPVDAKIMRTRGPIPDRNALLTTKKKVEWRPDEDGVLRPYGPKGKPLKSYDVAGMDTEPSAGAASLSHGAVHWWRNPDYWWDLINQARGERAKDGVRYASDDWAGQVSDVPRALPYIDQNPDLLNALFPDATERKQFKSAVKDVLRKHDFYNVVNPEKPTPGSRFKKKGHLKTKDDKNQRRFDFD